MIKLIETSIDEPADIYECSSCKAKLSIGFIFMTATVGTAVRSIDPKFCPNCGETEK